MLLANEIREGLGIAWDAVRANKMRSILATLGIVIGVVTVTLMGTAITGLNRSFYRSISFVGADVLYVQRFEWFVRSHREYHRMGKRRQITRAQAMEVARQMTTARAVAPSVSTMLPVSFGRRRSDSVYVTGTTDQFALISAQELREGRFISAAESTGARPVCVIGTDVADNLFQRGAALGQRIKIGSATFEVIGVIARQGSFLGMFSLDNQAIVPIKQFEAHFQNNPECEIRVKALSVAEVEQTRSELHGVMRRVRHLRPEEPDDFAINQQDQFVNMFHKVAGTIGGVGLFVTGLSLFVGGIGIMNIMFVSVAERTREIGIRKAIGAKKRSILIQFLIEAATICLIGGVIALAITVPLTFVINYWIPARMSLLLAGMALLVSLLTGILSGIVPAWRAANMDPVEALRNE